MSENAYPVKDSMNFIEGKWRSAATTDQLFSPVDGSVVVEVHRASASDVDGAVAAAVSATRSWSAVPAVERSALIAAIAARMKDTAGDFAAQMTAETGRPISESRTEVMRSISTMEISAEEAKRIAGQIVPMDAVGPGAGKLGFTLRVPIGVVAAITPFNAPLNSICHKLGPALAGGNSIVLKPHQYGSGMATLLAQISQDADLPAGLFNVVHGGPDIGRALTTHADVGHVNFTGSGKVAEQILGAIGLKRTLLELGGNAPTIVHHDANLDVAVKQLAEACFGLSGQSCISTQRILVHADVLERFTEKFCAMTEARVTGDVWDPSTQVGPMISQAAAQRVADWVDQAIADGARLLCGGRRDGAVYSPTILIDVPRDSKVICEEVFGPVVSLIPYSDIEDAFSQANNTPWGLKAGIFTDSLDVAMNAARLLDFGAVNINGASRSRVDQEPSGGVKQSGWGKEGPRHAIVEMTNERMISFAPVPASAS